MTYTSSNKKYATVSSKGLVKAKRAGKGRAVTITVKLKMAQELLQNAKSGSANDHETEQYTVTEI